ncbi:MAG: hypothetical protein EXR99_03680 [Gemmataceae bacterium]|nr:hypothetical protein [Gemmataceae bacterium]
MNAVLWLSLTFTAAGLNADPSRVEKFLHTGDFQGGEKALLKELKTQPKDSQLRFELGALQFIHAVEGLGQGLYRHGLRPNGGFGNEIPFMRLPVPENPDPQEISYEQFRALFSSFSKRISEAEKNLSLVMDESVRLPLRMGLIKLDMTGNGNPETNFKAIVNRYIGGNQGLPGALGDMPVTFDRGDALWLQGYCNLLQALTSFILAHDFQESFEVGATLVFPKVKTPHGFLNAIPRRRTNWFPDDIVDVIAFVHSWRFPLKHPDKMKESLAHLEKVIALSRETWKSILAETDDDNEWLPNPKQKGVLGIPVGNAMIIGWIGFLDDAEKILQGKLLLPYWREGETRGVNLNKVFTEPRNFDVIYWIQGTAATPYLEKGPTTSAPRWQMLQRLFRGEFIGFAFWFN